MRSRGEDAQPAWRATRSRAFRVTGSISSVISVQPPAHSAVASVDFPAPLLARNADRGIADADATAVQAEQALQVQRDREDAA